MAVNLADGTNTAAVLLFFISQQVKIEKKIVVEGEKSLVLKTNKSDTMET